jgi:hypothetical protein
LSARHVIRVAVVAGWLAGAVLILDGLPLLLASAAPAVAAGAGIAWTRWGEGAVLAARLKLKLKRAVKAVPEKGGSLERA